MKKLIMPIIALSLAMCATTAEAVIGSLSFARQNLYNAKMRAYNAKISYYNKASYHYTKKLPALTAKKYGYSLSKIKTKTKTKTKTSIKTKSSVPTYSAVLRAANSSSVSSLMSVLKGWGK